MYVSAHAIERRPGAFGTNLGTDIAWKGCIASAVSKDQTGCTQGDINIGRGGYVCIDISKEYNNEINRDIIKRKVQSTSKLDVYYT